MSINNKIINEFIKKYFNSFFKTIPDINTSNFSLENSLKDLNKKSKTLTKIFVSDAEIKHNNHKAKITLYIVNREKYITKYKYYNLGQIFIKEYVRKLFYKNIKIKINKINEFLKENLGKYKSILFNGSTKIQKNKLIFFRLKYLKIFLYLKHLFIKRRINNIILDSSEKYIRKLRTYEFQHSLNQYKLNQSRLLPSLSYILDNEDLIGGKEIEYNIINLKSFIFHPYIFTNILGLLITKNKSFNLAKYMSFILKKARLPKVNDVKERTAVTRNLDDLLIHYNDPKLISNINKTSNFNNLLNNYNKFNKDNNNIHNIIFNSINYKHLGGIRLELKGRLTKRYRADRAIYRFRYKGGLRNIYSSYQTLSTVLFRGNTNSNISYSSFKTKRRIGAFAVKG